MKIFMVFKYPLLFIAYIVKSYEDQVSDIY